jgi:muramoyltetrapeptide carboxypeptidase
MSLKKIQPEFLKPGDEVAIVSPAFAIDETKVNESVKILEEWGLKVHVGRNVLKTEGPFAGSDAERLADFSDMTSRKEIKAILFSRGGYGMLRIVDKIDFSIVRRYPKWFVGFSDITVLHNWLNERYNLISIHGEMPLNYNNPEKSRETMESLYGALFGDWQPVKRKGVFEKAHDISGELTGGNLSLIYSLIGTPGEPVTRGKILFIEEVGEYYYHLDRMMMSLKLAGKLEGLAGLVAGGFNKMEETKLPWNKPAEEIISDAVSGYGYPVLFNFPAGHVQDNRAFYFGRNAEIKVNGDSATLSFR